MKFSMLTGIFVLFISYSFATTWTVSNNPDRPAQFTTIQDAVDAASPNDTILITGGNYAGMGTFIPLVFYGEDRASAGVNITSGNFSFGRFSPDLSSNGSRVYNINFSSQTQIFIDNNSFNQQPSIGVMDDFIFERCLFSGGINSYIELRIRNGLSNVTIRNCAFYGGTNAGIRVGNGIGNNLSNVVITNCIFGNLGAIRTNSGSTFNVEGNMVLRNSLFLNSNSGSFGVTELVVENCIFYNRPPTGCSVCTFNNNFTYLTETNDLPYGNNLGSGNIESDDPFLQIFTDYPQLGADWSSTHDYSLAPGSPCIGAGTNGSDIGINDGNAPVTNIPLFPKIPTITELNIPVSSVPVGGTLQINVAAESR